MDFGVLGLDNLGCSNSAKNGSLGSENAYEGNNHKIYGSGFLNQDMTINEEDLRARKVAKTSSCGDTTSYSSGLNEFHQQMLSFTNTGYGCGGINAATILFSGFKGPFTTSQWMELEHQALIYKYIDANVPIPSYLLNPIRKALESSVGWGGFHLGFSNSDPEPGRCRRTDGKKWRCSRDAFADHKYCERHMNRGRHCSRKPVEGQSGHSASALTTNSVKSTQMDSSKLAYVVPEGSDANSRGFLHQQNNFQHGHNNRLSEIPSNSR